MLKKLVLTIIFCLFLVPASYASTITAGTYQLMDHPDGALSAFGPYGLRLDFLDNNIPGKGNKGPLFSVELDGASVQLTWNGGDTATISGTIFNNSTGDLWSVEHILEGVETTSQGFVASSGLMTLVDPFNTQYEIESKADSSGYVFLFLNDSHRCYGHDDCGPIVGRGWHNNQGTNDWLVQATLIPIPAALPLFLSGLVGFIAIRRKVVI